MPSSTVVTGGAGFIGRNTVAALNERGVTDILVVDSLGTDDKWQTLVGLTFDDIISPQAFLDRLNDGGGSAVTTIFHLGACSATTETDADYLLENNYRYTRLLCEWALAHDVRFIYASSAATYGGGELGFSDDDETTTRLRPLNMYGYSKQLVDLWALRSGALDAVVGLKFFNVFGPHEQHKGDMRSVVSKAYDEVGATGRLSLFKSYRDDYANGQQQRDFIYVRDAVDVMLFLADNPAVTGLFNCGSGTARTWADLAAAVFAAMGLPPAIDYVDMPDGLRDRYQYRTEAPMSKLRNAGYDRPFRTLELGVSEYVKWLAGSRD
ncbi:MAG TPA: ADP-glyceromanno-heptose 6-epimerase [Acidothermaceae bacterium]|jgi:ADP-L-glycero-D-manno-heptose 6-epimerase